MNELQFQFLLSWPALHPFAIRPRSLRDATRALIAACIVAVIPQVAQHIVELRMCGVIGPAGSVLRHGLFAI